MGLFSSVRLNQVCFLAVEAHRYNVKHFHVYSTRSCSDSKWTISCGVSGRSMLFHHQWRSGSGIDVDVRGVVKLGFKPDAYSLRDSVAESKACILTRTDFLPTKLTDKHVPSSLKRVT